MLMEEALWGQLTSIYLYGFADSYMDFGKDYLLRTLVKVLVQFVSY